MERASMVQNEHAQTLMGLGLSFLQAKTYLALAMLGQANVKTISKASNVARQDIYRIMPTLQKLGLAEKIIAKPTMYKATSIKKGLSIMLQNRKEEIAELQKKTKSLINNFHMNNAKIALQKGNTQFMITSEITCFLKMHIDQAQKVQESVDILIPLISVPSKVDKEWSHLNRALKRGVKIRLITQKAEEETTPKAWQTLAIEPFFEVRYLAAPVNFGMHIFDKKEVTLQVSAKNILPSLWSDNPHIIKLATSYFEALWKQT